MHAYGCAFFKLTKRFAIVDLLTDKFFHPCLVFRALRIKYLKKENTKIILRRFNSLKKSLYQFYGIFNS